MSTNTADTARWDRLAATLTEHGIQARVDRFGESHLINIRTENGSIHIGDKSWRKNVDVWAGWQVSLEDGDGIILKSWPCSKNRDGVAQNVAAALDLSRSPRNPNT